MTLDIITHPGFDGLQHGFFGRQGGASSGVFAGLNCGFGSSDQHEVVSVNRARVAAALGLGDAALVGVHQVHSARVLTVASAPIAAVEADALVTSQKGIALSVLTADCQPVLFADMTAGVIGAAHAGWKGALGGVLGATVAAMEDLGARRSSITAVIGPTISQENYEVGPEFRAQFLAQDQGFASYFAPGVGDRFLFDLPAFGLAQLAGLGIGTTAWTGHCTYADPARFYSYRRSTHLQEADYGRLIAAIRL